MVQVSGPCGFWRHCSLGLRLLLEAKGTGFGGGCCEGGIVLFFLGCFVISVMTFSGVRDLRDLVRSFEIQDLRQGSKPVAWKLDVVLRYLERPPFEPLGEVFFRDLSS